MKVPQIFDRNMKRLAFLDNAVSVGYSLEINSLWTATFTLPADDDKNAYCQPLNFVEIFDGDERIDLFRIIGEDLERSNGATRFYDCEHVLATLLSDVLFQYHQYGGGGIKTADVLNYVLARQTTRNWVLGDCDFKRYFEYNWENSTLLAALFAVPECFDSEYMWTWDTTVYPWTISLVAPSDTMKSEVRYAKNMTSMKKTVDASGIANRIYALGYGEGVNQLTIAGVNGGKPYVEDNPPSASSPSNKPNPIRINTQVPIQKSIRFFMIMLPAFFALVNPASTIANPACIKNTNAAPIKNQIPNTSVPTASEIAVKIS